MCEVVDKFNRVTGNPPVGIDGDVEAFWRQIKSQAEFVLEEAKELLEAIEERDIVECLDGHLDVRYLNEYVETLLEEAGVNTRDGFYRVAANNSSKYTKSYIKARDSQDMYKEQGIDCYILEVEDEGDFYYTVKRSKDGKVMKLRDHTPPDLSICTRQFDLTLGAKTKEVA